MRVLWVTSQLPSPRAGAGEVLEYELLRFTSRLHEVHVISSGMAPADRDSHLESIGVTYEGVSWERSSFPRTRPVLLWQLATKNSGVILWRQGNRAQALSDALDRAQEKLRPDLVQVVMSETAPVLRAASHPRALLLFDAHTRQLERELVNAPSARARVSWMAQLRKARQWERTWYALADGIACNSPLDADALSALLERAVDVIPNSVPREFFEDPRIERSANIVTFIAHLGYRPNVDAAMWLCEVIWPLVRRRRPEARLRLLGRNPIPDVIDAAQRAGASLDRDVPDVRPYYWESAVTVAPIRLGSGLRNKVLHAMACESPLVATSVAIEGFELEHRRHLLIADEATDFADAIVDVLDDADAASVRARNAKTYSRLFHGDAVGDRFVDWWEGMRRLADQ